MFSRISRYRKLPDAVVPDVQGRAFASKALRLLPDVTGTFQHTVTDGDRLDHLAFRYYRQPRKWWRICDANPSFLSPVDLLGSGPVRTARLRFADPGGALPWAALARSLGAHTGVERFRFADDVLFTAVPQTIAGQQVVVNVESHQLSALVTYNELLVGTVELAGMVAAAGFLAVTPEAVGRAGTSITVPPDVVG